MVAPPGGHLGDEGGVVVGVERTLLVSALHGEPGLGDQVGEAVGVPGLLAADEGHEPGVGESELPEPVDDPSAHAGVVDYEGVDPLPVAVGLKELGGAHGVAPAHPPDDPGDRALPPDDDGLRLSESGYVARDDDLSLWLEAPLGCADRVAEAYDGVGEVVREPAEHAADVHGVVPTPFGFAVGDVLRGDHAGHGEAGEVGDVARADTHGVVHRPLRVVGVVEGSGRHERVAGHEGQGGVEAPEGVDVGPGDGVGLGDDDHQVGGVEAL